MVSSATTHLKIPSLPPPATESHSFKHLAYGSLFSVGQACYHNCTAGFDKNYVKLFKSSEVNINLLCTPIIKGNHNVPTQNIYSVSLPANPPSTHKSNATINVSYFRDCIDFYHGALFYPTIST